MSFTARADPDFMRYLEDLARLACVALEFTGPLEFKYTVPDGCTIIVTVKKE